MFQAIFDQDFNTVKKLVETGVNINKQDKQWITPLRCAIIKPNNEQIIEYLLEHGADINAIDPRDGETCLGSIFCTRSHCTYIDLLLRYKCDLNAQNKKGITTLMSAVDINCAKCAKKLIDSGADLDITDNDGNTALIIAAEYFIDFVPVLIEHGANLYIKNSLDEDYDDVLDHTIDGLELAENDPIHIELGIAYRKRRWSGGLIECCVQYIYKHYDEYKDRLYLLNRDIKKLFNL